MAGWRDVPLVDETELPPELLLNYGAPISVRAVVEASRPRDRLTVLRSFYPDAEPIAGDNFIFTDETGGKRTYNKPGADLGDVTAGIRPTAETIGAIVGGGLAAPAGPGGMAAGGALGATAADQLLDLGLAAFGVPQGGTPLQRMVTDPAQDLMLGTTSELGGAAAQNLVQRGGQAVMRGLTRPEAPQVIGAATRLGIRPTVGMVARPGLTRTEDLAAQMLPMSAANRGQTRVAAETAARAVNAIPGAPLTREEARSAGGAAVKEGAERSYERFRTAEQRLLDDVYNVLPPDTIVPADQVRALRDELAGLITQAPESSRLSGVLERVDAFLRDADQFDGGLPVATQRRLRTDLGAELETAFAPGTKLDPRDVGWLKRLRRAMSDDLRTAAAATSPEALRRLNRHDRLVVAFRGSAERNQESIAKSLDKIIKAGSDEAAYSALMSSSGGVNRLRNVMGRLNNNEREVVARAAWDRMLTTTGGNFNLNNLLNQWNKANPSARRELFGRVANMDDLEDLMTVIGGMREADRIRNFSNTAYTLLLGEFGENTVSRLVGMAGGASGGAGGLAYAGLPMVALSTLTVPVAAYALSAAVHRPGVARALANSLSGQPVARSETLSRSLGRIVTRALSGDEEDEPENLPELQDILARDRDKKQSPLTGWRAVPLAN